jgi:hypothetical protein
MAFLGPVRFLAHACEKVRNALRKALIARERPDSKSGKTYWHVRWNDVRGKQSVS